MKKKLNKVAKDTNLFLKKFIFNQKKNRLMESNKVWIIARGKKDKIKINS